MATMKEQLKEFIEKYKKYFILQDYDKIFDINNFDAEVNALLPKHLMKVLLDVGINPLPKLSKIPYGAFYGNLDLKNITIPSNVEVISMSAFYECKNLGMITINNPKVEIGHGAFYGCNSLDRINFIGSIEEWFNINHSETGLYLHQSGSILFTNNKVNDLKIPSNVKSIPECVFYNDIDLKSITIPISVKIIQLDAFSLCDNLSEIKYEGTINQWRQVEKPYSWASFSGTTRVKCLDGDTGINE